MFSSSNSSSRTVVQAKAVSPTHKIRALLRTSCAVEARVCSLNQQESEDPDAGRGYFDALPNGGSTSLQMADCHPLQLDRESKRNQPEIRGNLLKRCK
jgi:hypothetical protein